MPTRKRTPTPPSISDSQAFADLATEIIEKGSKIRAEVAATGEASHSEGRRATSKLNPTLTQRERPIFRIKTIDKERLEEIAFHERDSRGSRPTMTSLMDEAVELLIKSRELVHVAELRGLTPKELMILLVEEAQGKRKAR